MTRLLTLKEIARQLDIPESSLRKYRELFSRFIPSVGKGRSRRYRPAAIEVLRDIRQMREEMHMPWDSITDQLAEKYPIEAEPADAPMPVQQEFYAGDETEVVTHNQPPQAIAAPATEKMMRKMAAISENQAMMVNAMAVELINRIDAVRTDAERDAEQLRVNMAHALENLSQGLNAISESEQEVLGDVLEHVVSIDTKLDAMSADSEKNNNLDEVKAALKTVKSRLDDREATIKESRVAIEAMKKENASLKEFKRRHRDSNREDSNLASRSEKAPPQKTTFLSKIFGSKS